MELAKLYDGPYVFYKGNKRNNYMVKPNEKAELVLQEQTSLSAVTDVDNIMLPIQLKSEIKPEPTIYAKPTKMLVVSDIGGNFNALRRLLLNNGVMDSNFNWTFGDGHFTEGGGKGIG